MLEGKQLVLATRPYAKENRTLSWFHFLTTTVLLALGYWLVLGQTYLPLRLAGTLMVSLLLVRMFMLYHDYMHQAIFHKSLPMKWFFMIYGLLILAPMSIWKRSHNYHHANNSKLYTSSIGSFPIVTTQNFLEMSNADRRAYLFVRHPLTILFGYFFAFVWGMSVLSFARNPGKHWDSLAGLVLHALTAGLIYWYFGAVSFLLAFLVPLMISGAIGSYLFYAQHNFPGTKFTDKEGWTYAGAAMNSSSFMRGGRLMNWLTANIGYHQIHHANARIPFYRLPEVLEALPEFEAAGKTSLRPTDIARCLALKVWDPELDRMLTKRELRALG